VDILFKVLPIVYRAYPVYAKNRIFPHVSPTVFEHLLIEHPTQIANPTARLAGSLFCYRLQ